MKNRNKSFIQNEIFFELIFWEGIELLTTFSPQLIDKSKTLYFWIKNVNFPNSDFCLVGFRQRAGEHSSKVQRARS